MSVTTSVRIICTRMYIRCSCIHWPAPRCDASLKIQCESPVMRRLQSTYRRPGLIRYQTLSTAARERGPLASRDAHYSLKISLFLTPLYRAPRGTMYIWYPRAGALSVPYFH